MKTRTYGANVDPSLRLEKREVRRSKREVRGSESKLRDGTRQLRGSDWALFLGNYSGHRPVNSSQTLPRHLHL